MASEAENKAAAAVAGQSASGGKKARPKRERKFVEVTNDLPPVWEDPKEGDFIEGFYVRSQEIKFRKSSFLTHVLQDEETGELKSFSGAIADRKMARIPRGTFVRVTYLGETRTSNGDAKDYRVDAEEGTRLLDEHGRETNVAS